MANLLLEALDAGPEPSVGAKPSRNLLLDALGPSPDVQPERTWLGTAGDVVNTAAQAAVTGGEALVGLANIPTAGRAGKFMEDTIGWRPKETKAILNDALRSDAQAWADKQVEQADGFVDSLKAYLKNPSTIFQTAATSVPSMYVGGGFGKAVGAVAPKLGRLAQAAIGEGAVSAGSTAEQIRQESKTGTLTAGQTGLSVVVGAVVGLLGAGGGKLARKLGIDDVDQFVLGLEKMPEAERRAAVARIVSEAANSGVASPVKKPLPTAVRIPAAMVQEGVVEEAPQSAVEQMGQNLALDEPLTKGVGKQVAGGMLSGAVLAGGTNTITAFRDSAQQEAPPPAAPAAESKVSAGLLRQAFAQVGGAGETIQEQGRIRGMTALALSNMTDEEFVQALPSLAEGDEALAQQLSAARQDQELVKQGRLQLSAPDAPPGSWDAYLTLSNAIRRDAGLVDMSTAQPTVAYLAQTLSKWFPTVAVPPAPMAPAAAPATPGAAPETGPAGEPLNSAGFLPESPDQVAAQIQAVREGRKPAAAIGLEEAQTADVSGLSPGIATGPDGRQAMILAPTDEAVQAVVTRAAEVGLEQALGELLGYVNPTATTVPTAGPTAVVQQIDHATGQPIQEELVSPEQAGDVVRLPGTSVRVLPVMQAAAERQMRAEQNAPVPMAPPAAPAAAPGPTVATAPVAQPMSQPAAVTPVSAVKQPSTAVKQLIDAINTQNGLEAADQVDVNSLREVAPRSVKDKGKRRMLSQLQQAAKSAFGVDLIWVEAPTGSLMRKDGKPFMRFNGFADRDNNRVFMQVDGASTLTTMAHELAHLMEKLSPEAYARVEEVILSRVNFTAYLNLKENLERLIRAESKGNVNAQRLMAEVRSELVAEAIGQMAADSGMWKAIFDAVGDSAEVKSLYDKVMEVISKMARAVTRTGYIAGLRDIKEVSKAVTNAFVEWSAEHQKSTAKDAAAPASAKPAEATASPVSEAAAPTKARGKKKLEWPTLEELPKKEEPKKEEAKPEEPKKTETAVAASRAMIGDREYNYGRGGDNYTPPPIESFMSLDLVRRANAFVNQYFVKKEVSLDPELRAQAEALLRPKLSLAAAVKDEFDQMVIDTAKESGAIGQMIPPELKGMKRAAEKLAIEEEMQVENIRDLLRATLVFDTYADAAKAVEAIRNKFDVLRIKDRTDHFLITGKDVAVTPREVLGGYADVLINIVMPNGTVGEIQLNTPEMLAVKENQGHKLYEAARDQPRDTPLRRNIYSAMQDVYDAAFLAATDRANSRKPAAQFKKVDSVIGAAPEAGAALTATNSSPESPSLKTLPSGKTTNSSPENEARNSVPAGKDSGTFISPPSSTQAYSTATAEPPQQEPALPILNSRDIDRAIAGEAVGPQAVLERAPDALARFGLTASAPIAIDDYMIRKVVSGKEGSRDGLTKAQLLDLGNRISAPAAVFRSATRDDSIVVMTDMVVNGHPVVVAIDRGRAKQYKIRNIFLGTTQEVNVFANYINSAYPKDDIGSIEGWLRKGLLLEHNPRKTENADRFPPKIHTLLRQHRANKGKARVSPSRIVAPEDELSTTYPTVVQANHVTQGRFADYATAQQDMTFFTKIVRAMSQFTGIDRNNVMEAAEANVEFLKRNILWMYDTAMRIAPQPYGMAKQWYIGGNKLAGNFAEQWGKTKRQVVAMLAVTSPSMDWYQNVDVTRRLGQFLSSPDKAWTPEMEEEWQKQRDAAVEKGSQGAEWVRLLDTMHRRRLSQLSLAVERAQLFDIWDRAHGEPGFQVINPEGEFVGLSRTAVGEVAGALKQSLDNLTKAVAAFDSDDATRLYHILGKGHKVRNFYNNLISPDSANGFTTVDTHAVAVAHLKPLSNKADEVAANFGGKNPGSSVSSAKSGLLGISGTYPIYVEAYRRAAQEREVLPREMQSITWEAVRVLFGNKRAVVVKGGPILVDRVNALWDRVRRGESSEDEARSKLIAEAGGFGLPGWAQSSGGVADVEGPSIDPGELAQRRAQGARLERAIARGSSRRAVGAADGRTEPAAGVAAKRQDADFTEAYGREEDEGYTAPAGSTITVLRFADRAGLSGVNAGNTGGVAWYIASLDGDGPRTVGWEKSNTLYAYRITVPEEWGKYNLHRSVIPAWGGAASAEYPNEVPGRWDRGKGVIWYSFPPDTSAELVGQLDITVVRKLLEQRGYYDFDDSGSIAGGRVIKQAFLDAGIRMSRQTTIGEEPANDSDQQLSWLNQQAQQQGYDNVDTLAEENMPAFMALAEKWRDEHPTPVMASRPLKAMSAQDIIDMANTGKMNYTLGDAVERGQWAEAYSLAKNVQQRQSLLRRLGDWAIETLADAFIPVKRWIDSLPLSTVLKQRMTGDLYRAATVRAGMQKDVKRQFTDQMFRAIEAASKATKLTSDQVKALAGYWMTAKYAPKANAWLIAKDQAALIAAQQSGDPALIAQAQLNLMQRQADVNGPIGGPRSRGVAGGLNNAEAAQAVAAIEAKIPQQLLEDIAKPVYAMLTWKKAVDVRTGKVSQLMVNSWPNHRDYVPLTGDPRWTPETEDVFSSGGQLNQDKDYALNGRKDSVADDAIDAAFEATMKSINFAGMQDFKRSLNLAYENARQNNVDIGLSRQPVTGIVRTGDDVVIYRDTTTTPGGLQQPVSHAFRFADKRVIEALKRDNEEELPRMLKMIATPTRWYARMVTQWMPMFAPVNMLRDLWERSELLRTRKLVDSHGVAINVKHVARAAIAHSIDPKLWRASFDYQWNTQRQSAERNDLDEMIRLGGSSVWGDYLARTAGDLEAELRRSYGYVAKGAKFANQTVENYNNLFEMIAPLAIYRGLKQAGMAPKDAAAATLDLMNFKKRGTAMPAVRALYVFSQPAITSGYNLAQYLSTRTGQIRFTAQLLIGTALYALLKSMWGDDEDDLGNRLDNLSNFTVERSIPIPIGDKVLKVPVGFGAPQLAWAGAATLNRWLSGRYDTVSALGELAKSMAKNVSPIAPSEMEIAKNPGAWLAQTFTPTIAKPIMAIATEKTVMGAPLKPQFLDPDKWRSEQAKRSTPEAYKQVATAIREMTGVDIFPDNIKALADGWLVGPIREILNATIENPAKEMRGEPGRMPVVSQLLDTVNDRRMLDAVYYRFQEEAGNANREYESRLRDGTLSEWVTPERLQQVQAFKVMEKTERRLGAMRGRLTKMGDSIDTDTKSAYLQQIEAQSDAARRDVLRRFVPTR